MPCGMLLRGCNRRIGCFFAGWAGLYGVFGRMCGRFAGAGSLCHMERAAVEMYRFCHIVVRRRRCPVPQRIPGDGARLFQRIRCGVCGGRIGLCGLVLWMQSLAGDGHGRGMGYFVVGNAVGGLWRRLLLCSIFPDRDLTAAHILRDLSAIRPGSVVDGTVILCICIRPNRVSFAERLTFVDGHGVAACACFLRGSLVIHCGFPFLMELCRDFPSKAGKIGRDLDYPLYKTGKIWYPIRGRED